MCCIGIHASDNGIDTKCDVRTWYVLLGWTLWLCLGVAALTYCLLSTTSPTMDTLLLVKVRRESEFLL